MDIKPVVAHLVRIYLAPTETFIRYQITNLKSFEPIVLCHSIEKNNGPVVKDVFASIKILKGFHRILANYSYKFMRHLTKKECEILIDAIAQNKSKLLHFHYAVDARYFLNLKKNLNLPGVVSLYGYDTSSFPRTCFGYGKIYLMPIFEAMDIFLSMSEDMKRDLIMLGCPEKKIVVHYYGIEVQKFANPEKKYEDNEIVNILMIGTLEIKKAQHLVLRALKEIENQMPQKFTITIVGDGPMKSHLVKMVKEYGWQNKVNFLGFIPYSSKQLVNVYHNADIFALPSITVKGDKEGIPGTIVEAMASGLPVVSSYHAGIPEVIENYKQGILVKEKDIKGLSGALKELIKNKNLRERLGRAAAERAIKNFDVKNRTENLEKIYQSLL